MKKLLILAILFMLPVATALNTNSTCIDADTLFEEIHIYHYIDGSLDTEEIWNQTSNCNLGCYDGQCLENTDQDLTLPALMFLSVIFAYFMLWKNAEDKKFRITFLFLFLLTVAGAIVMSINYLENSFGDYQLRLWVTFLRLHLIWIFVITILTIVYSMEKGKKWLYNIFDKFKSGLHG